MLNPNNQVIRKQIEKVGFGFYTDEDVRSRSVCEITSSVAVDSLGTPLPNGVYDPRMGPSTAESPPCPTCALRYLECPGHFGHIELCVPLYHPLLFGKLVELLRIKCLNCHQLTLPKRTLRIYDIKLRLVEHGRYQEAIELDDKLAAKMKEGRGGQIAEEKKVSIHGAGLAIDSVLSEISKSLSSPSQNNGRLHKNKCKLSVLELDYQRQLAREVIVTCKEAKSCPHCGAYSPRIRQDSANKVFQAAMSATHKRLNDADGIKFQPALSKPDGRSSNTNNNRRNNDTGYDSDNTNMDDNDDDDNNGEADKEKQSDDEDDDANAATESTGRDKYMHPAEVKAQFQRTWDTNPNLCKSIFATQGWELFFMQAIPVPPNRFRPPMVLGTMMVEHAQNTFLNKIIATNEIVRGNFANNDEAKAYARWIDLQTHLNCFMDSSKDPAGNAAVSTGIRQLLERKEGIFRKHMMGKRVNYACRSVISPDPYIGTNEIGIPRHFAHTLTYPTPVTDINIEQMRTLVERGPDQYPGARWVEFPDRRVDLSKMDRHKREAVAARMLMYSKRGDQRPAIVGRQLQDGDMVLMNRQPTLHKPGIMAHEVRILQNPTQKTIRMHYANCNTYNADYDGDEMNCHFPQSDLARAEAEYVAKTDLQFIVPTDGSPLRGLIQDHVVAGVKLTSKDTFLEKWEYQQLLFAALASLPRLELIRSDENIEMMPPAIIKPKPRWTGKQVISTLLDHLRKGNDRDIKGSKPFPGISTERKAKTPSSAFGSAHQEGEVLFRDGELLRGVLDKAAFGATNFSLVHAVYEAYGPEKAGLLLNSLGRLFTSYLQFFSGHSCRVEDLVLTKESDKVRRRLIEKAFNTGARAAKAWSDSEGGKVPIELEEKDSAKPLKPVEAASTASKVADLLSGADGKNNSAAFDGFMMSKLNPLSSDIVKACLPDGLAVSFPTNTFSIMCTTGAKGSIVNQSQVSCALGQQALEGRRVPRLSSGRTLPSFAPYDVNPRADGFVMDRFLTGIRPQEYYFHCMAGREGLVDTAVKTSRSGYLQRCLVKHLEELKVCYDYTVRNGEGGVVQFLYGEDGLDPTKASYLDCSEKSFVYMARNYKALKRGQVPLPNPSITTAANDAGRSKEVSQRKKKQIDLLQVGDFVLARRLRVGTKWERGCLCDGWRDATILKIVKKNRFNIRYMKDGHVEKNVPLEVKFTSNGSLSNRCVLIKAAAPDPVVSSSRSGHRLGTNGSCVSERLAEAAKTALGGSRKLKEAMASSGISSDEFSSLVAAKYGASLCAPGEAVGCIAAQSIGEPSTQMTLNTFHLAGAGANVTLGIPRLREIIMTASRTLKTPTMSVPLNNDLDETEAVKLARSFKKLSLNEVIASHQGITVRETLMESDSGKWERAYCVTLKLHPAERIKAAFGLSLNDIAKVIAKSYVPALSHQMKLELRRAAADGEGIVSVEGGDATMYVHTESSNEENNTQHKDKETDELEEDDDAQSVEGGIEDGVAASRVQGESYEEKDEDDERDEDDDKSDASGDSSLPNSETKATENSTPSTTAETDEKSNFLGSGVKVDTKRNSIQLQPLRVDPSARPLLMVGLVETAAIKTLVRARKNIDEAFLNDEDGRGRCLQTAGINFEEIWKLEKVDHNRLMSNDIWAVRCAYGVEAARQSIKDQIRSVFGAYGIEVDPRHLSLIADYMTYTGNYTPMNRNGMKEISSPFLQMSFETTATFLTDASLRGGSDELQSPSANIVVGRPVRHGTGSFSVLVK